MTQLLYLMKTDFTLGSSDYLYKEILKVDEACAFLGISKNYLYKLTHRHQIPFSHPNGKLIYFERTYLMAWMRRNRVPSNDELESSALDYVTRN